MFISLDQRISQKIAKFRHNKKLLNYFWVFCARYLIFIIMAAAASQIILIQNTASKLDYIFLLIFVIITAWTITYIIELIFSRKRPFESLKLKPLIYNVVYTPSFPSAHTSVSFALAANVFLFNNDTGLLFYIIAMFVGFARIYVGVHYVTDVLAGAFVGFTVTLVLHMI